jgi:hypothetical protein
MGSGRVPAALRGRLGDDATFGLIELLGSERRDWSEQVTSMAANRFERRLTEEMSALRQDIAGVRVELRHDIAGVRVEWLKWSFAFWLGQIAVMAGLLAFMLRR